MSEILDLRSPTDWEMREKFLPSLVADVENIERIIGKYDLPRAPAGSAYGTGMVICGFNKCNEKHYRGFLLKLKDGRETIIGRDCGRTKLGVVFEEIVASFKADETRHARKTVIQKLQDTRDSVISEAESLLPKVEQAENRVSNFIQDLSKFSGFWRKLEEANALDGKVLIEVEKSKWVESNSKANVATGALIRGLHIIFSDNSVYRRGLRIKVLHWLRQGIEEEITLAGDDIKKLGELVSKAAEVRNIVREAGAFCDSANQFFTAENIAGLDVIRDQQLRRAEKSNALDRALRRQTQACNAASS